MSNIKWCGDCNGSGGDIHRACRKCGGTGTISKREDVAVNCKVCNKMTKYELVLEGRVCEEWKCKVCGVKRLFGK